ncbi:relaxase/mobilization nuclease domain-containing protein, partial [Streptomyces sp. UMAF16]|nr:relaxase/mobilization nuclease domain-containing protein [Streptomyces sp. UMAF16]
GFNTKRDKARSTGSFSPVRRGGHGLRGRKSRVANQASVRKKAPEVMVKITGSSKGLATARNHIDYISRNGDVELITEQGEILAGNRAIRDYKELLRLEQIPESSSKREFLHVIFSMPKDTQVSGLKEAVSNFCKEEFSNRRYVMAFHDDTDHRHVHVCVGTRDIERADEPRLSPRKSDLRTWRESFAAQLRDVGIEAAASPRNIRFNHKKGRNFVVDKIDSRGQSEVSKRMLTQEKLDARPVNPAQASMEKIRTKVLSNWNDVLKQEIATNNTQGIAEVKSIIETGLRPVSSRSQDSFDEKIKANTPSTDKQEKSSSAEDDFDMSH